MAIEYVELIRDAMERGDWRDCRFTLQQLIQAMADQPAYGYEVQELVLEMALQVLEEGDFETRWIVAKLFPALGSRAIVPLMDILRDETADLDERWFAGRVLGGFRNPEVIEVLITTLEHTQDPDLGAIVAQALGEQGRAAIGPLTAIVLDPQRETQTLLWAVQALSQLPDGAVVQPLLAMATHQDPQVRATTLLALGNFTDDRYGDQIANVLQDAVQDQAGVVRRAAVTGLGRRACPTMAPVLLPVLAPLLGDVQIPVGEQAALAIGRLKTPEAADRLLQELQNPLTPPPLQFCLVRALGWMELPRAIEGLYQVLHAQLNPGNPATRPESTHLNATPSESVDPDPLILEIIQVLGRVTSETLRPLAARLLLQVWETLQENPARHLHGQPGDDRFCAAPSPKILQTLAYAWSLLKDSQAIPPLQALQNHPHPQVRFHAIAALNQFEGHQG